MTALDEKLEELIHYLKSIGCKNYDEDILLECLNYPSVLCPNCTDGELETDLGERKDKSVVYCWICDAMFELKPYISTKIRTTPRKELEKIMQIQKAIDEGRLKLRSSKT